MLNHAKLAINNDFYCVLVYMLMLILEVQVSGCISAHPRLSHQKMKQQTIVMHENS